MLAEVLPERPQNLVVLRVSAGRLLRVEQLISQHDLEHPTVGWDKGDLRQLMLELGDDLVRQTDGSGAVASA